MDDIIQDEEQVFDEANEITVLQNEDKESYPKENLLSEEFEIELSETNTTRRGRPPGSKNKVY